MPACPPAALLLAVTMLTSGAPKPVPTKTPKTVPGPQSTDLQRFCPKSFTNPEPFYWPGYMWVWNDRLTEATITRQMEDMASQRALTVTPLPEPSDFRPTFMPTRLEPDYMSAEFMACVRHMGEEAKRLGMRIWLYDEGGWPSGSVCGRLVRENPQYARQTLTREVRDTKPGDRIIAPAGCLAAFLEEPGEPPRRVEPGKTATARVEGSRLLVFSVSQGGRYPDLLNPAATREFIRLTHEPYQRVLGDLFGTTVPMIFTDEPAAANPPWTDGIEEDFRAKMGYDIRDRLPSLFAGDRAEDKRARIDYFDWWSARLAEAYFGQIQDWCRLAGILSGGHVGGEDETLGAARYGFGHVLRALRRLDVPGVDVIWRQVWPGKQNHHFPKYAATVARQENRRWALTESFAVYGNGLTPAQMKWIADYQYVRGVNLMTMIGYPLSTSDWLVGGERPHFCADAPLWREMHGFHAYVARLSYALSLGQAVARTAVYLPVRDIWAGGPEATGVAESNDRLAAALLERQCDYDFVDDDSLDASTVKDGALVVGAMSYDTVCVSRSAWMSESARRKLAELSAAGGRVLFVDPAPGVTPPPGCSVAALADAAQAARPLAVVEPANTNVRVMARDLDGGRLYFLTNESTGPIDVVVTFPDRAPLRVLDPETGAVGEARATRASGGTRVRLSLAFAGSRVLLFTRSRLPGGTEPRNAARELLAIRGGWQARSAAAFRLAGNGIEAGPTPDAQLAAMPLGDWRSALGHDFSGEAEYVVRFRCTASDAREARVLDLGDVRYCARVTLNGKDLGARLWPPFSVRVAGAVRADDNELRVTVTNTFANQYLHSKSLDQWTSAQLGPYHPRALAFEKDALPSGLFGPVRLLGE